MSIDCIVTGVFGVNTYLYSEASGKVWIVDPGGDNAAIEARISQAGLTLAGVILTHGHFDHILGLKELYAHNPGIPVYIHALEAEALTAAGFKAHKELISNFSPALFAMAADALAGLPEATMPLSDGDAIPDTKLRVIHTPGHTPGSICCYSAEEQLLIAGDTLFQDGIGRTDLPGGSYQTLMQSIRQKLWILDPEVAVYPGHGPATSIGAEKRLW